MHLTHDFVCFCRVSVRVGKISRISYYYSILGETTFQKTSNYKSSANFYKFPHVVFQLFFVIVTLMWYFFLWNRIDKTWKWGRGTKSIDFIPRTQLSPEVEDACGMAKKIDPTRHTMILYERFLWKFHEQGNKPNKSKHLFPLPYVFR